MKEKYIELMERTLAAYSNEHILRYFNDVKQNGLTEHGFPRLTSNIGILISHGRRTELLPLFLEMMEFCCKSIPRVKAANDFSVREIVTCIRAVEDSGVASQSDVDRWKEYLAAIDPASCYNVVAKTPIDKVKNWALFTGVSEFFRQRMGLCDSSDFIDTQLATQLQWLDQNGMYMDAGGDVHHPIMYDLVPRGLFAALLTEGYRGVHYSAIDECLRKSGLLTLKMQSPNGEMAFGGRSNQFIHNEPWMIATFEYEAKRYASLGDLEMVKKFKSAIKRAIAVTEKWLSEEPIYHIKNRFPTETKFGCENYAYFDKYMITVASNLYAAYLICDDSIEGDDIPDTEPSVFATTEHFHKLFLKSGGYGIEFDLNGDPHYDASGLGRVHKAGAPSTVCLSVPCPKNPNIVTDLAANTALSLCPGVKVNGEWKFATDADTKYEIIRAVEESDFVIAELICSFPNGTTVKSEYTVNETGVKIKVAGEKAVAFMLPAFFFDGERKTDISINENSLTVSYKGAVCTYRTSGEIQETEILSANRNGHYKMYFTTASKALDISIKITN